MGSFVDGRGEILDLVGPVDSVTQIRTLKGATRGNHVHKETCQWTYLVSGSLLVADEHGQLKLGPNLRLVVHPAGVAHAWRALEDSVCLVFTRGPRSGENYEDDTYRLKEPLL